MVPRMAVRIFDTIVVGSGASGAVIAARVTERSDRDVLLLEAGPDYPDLALLREDLRDGTRNSYKLHDWGYTHRPNSQQRLVFPLPRGKVVGGSSAVNTCIALRGVPSDYDEWAARALPEWTFANCLPAFKRLENDLDIRNEWHGQDGPVPLRRHTPEELVPWQRAFMEAARELGFPRCDDHNAPDARGYGPHAMNKIDGVRMSAARCYLTPSVRARPNFTLRPETLVRRVLFEQRRAIGVEVETLGRIEVVRARRVVLCAGAIATPGVLLRSGVGPRAIVERLGVVPVSDVRAVGAQLLDHPGFAFFLVPRRGVSDARHPIIQTALRFRTSKSAHENDGQIQAGSFVMLPSVNLPLVSVMGQVGKPRGRGRIEYSSANPHARPVIHSQLLDDPDDRATAVEVLQVALECARSAPMRALAPTILWPPERVLARKDSLDRWIRTVNDSGYHPCGTVPMGADDDREAATDQYGRVRGVEGLYVADASLMPTVPTGNIHIPVLMMGERFGEWLAAA